MLDELINNEILLERAKKLNSGSQRRRSGRQVHRIEKPVHRRRISAPAERPRRFGRRSESATCGAQLSIQKLLNREVVAKITITDQDINDFYNANKAQFNVAEPQYRIAQIVVTPRKEPQIRNRKNDDATNEAEAQRKVKMLMDRLEQRRRFRAAGDGLFRRHEFGSDRRRPRLRSGVRR